MRAVNSKLDAPNDASTTDIQAVMASDWLSSSGVMKTFSLSTNTTDIKVFSRRHNKKVRHLPQPNPHDDFYLKDITPTPTVLLERLIANTTHDSSSDEDPSFSRQTIRCSEEDLLIDLGCGSLLASHLFMRHKSYYSYHEKKSYSLHHALHRSDDHQIRGFFEKDKEPKHDNAIIYFLKRLFMIQTVMTLLGDLDAIFTPDANDDNAFIEIINHTEIRLEPIDIEAGITNGLGTNPQELHNKFSRDNFYSTFVYTKTNTIRNLDMLLTRIQFESNIKDRLMGLANEQLTLGLWTQQLTEITHKTSRLRKKMAIRANSECEHSLQTRYRCYLSDIDDQLKEVIDYNPTRIAQLNKIRKDLEGSILTANQSPSLFASRPSTSSNRVDVKDIADKLKEQMKPYTISISSTDLKLMQLKMAWIQFIKKNEHLVGGGVLNPLNTIDSLIHHCDTTCQDVIKLENQLHVHQVISCY